jgi:Cu2+-exporting ATPase
MRQGIEVIMLTEIIKNTAKAVADELHLTSFIAVCLRTNQRNSKIASRREIAAMAE